MLSPAAPCGAATPDLPAIPPDRARTRRPRGAAPCPGGRIYGYTRVSTDMQAEHGQWLELQRDQLDGWAKMTQRRIDHLIVEAGVSGSIPFAKRPEGASCSPTSRAAMPWCAPRSTGSAATCSTASPSPRSSRSAA